MKGTRFRPERAVYLEARKRWIAGERDTLLAWIRDVMQRPSLSMATLQGYANRQGWPRRYKTRAS